MNDDILENINNALSHIEQLNIPKKFVRDRLHATEFNEVVDKINEIKSHINGPVKNTFIDTTSYILEKINNTHLALNANNIPIEEGSSVSIFNELQNINNKLNNVQSNSETNAATISSLLSSLDDIGTTLGIYSEKFDNIESEIETSYNAAKEYTDAEIESAYNAAKEYTDAEVESAYNAAKEYTDAEVEKSYTKLYTEITDTTLTFEYNINTEPVEPKKIYDSDDELYDGTYHD